MNCIEGAMRFDEILLAAGTVDFSGKSCTSGTIELIAVRFVGDIWNSNSAARQLIQVVPDRG